MTVSFCADEHVPSVFITTLQSSGYDVIKANTIFGEGTNDRQLLEYCAENEYLFITHDKKDFSGPVSNGVDHAGIIIYTNPVLLRDDPDGVVRTLERVLGYYSPQELAGEQIWLDQWHSS
ncbi:DUF5615 family PIN-like protein [Natrarchaeobius oligotrophus]|uniref:DUF5615 family PIN-like protein n=1 Tax=Natrarchaeobius oligotrophus TaxID=3455743 RepID=UPI003744367B